MYAGLQQKNPSFFLFSIIIIEGYIVLSTELLAIRLSVPFVGSGTDTISIIIAAVLLPLSFGYYSGGIFQPHKGLIHYKTIRKKLTTNLLIALTFLLPALSYSFLSAIFQALTFTITPDIRIQAALYATFLLAPPIYLLGQTIPLVSNYFSSNMLPRMTGKILFFSTLGSFAGATLSTLVLMSFIGVHYTASLNFLLLFFLIWMLSKDKKSLKTALACILLIIGVFFNSGAMMSTFNIVENNVYNTISVLENETERHLIINNNFSSKYTENRKKYKYIEFIERVALGPIWNGEKAHDILIIGAGGFTIGHEDHVNNYDFVDIDKSLKTIAEQHILKEKLLPNQSFHARPARAFLNETKKRYDVIILDAYTGYITIPEQLITIEFFQQIREHLKDNGIVAANIAVSPNFNTPISRHIDNTFRSAFPYVSRHVIYDGYNLWNNEAGLLNNVIYLYRHIPNDQNDKIIYSDLKNQAYFDKHTY